MSGTTTDLAAELAKLDAADLARLVRRVATRRLRDEQRRVEREYRKLGRLDDTDEYDRREQLLVEGDQSARWEDLAGVMDDYLDGLA